jgi:hypothetical protein
LARDGTGYLQNGCQLDDFQIDHVNLTLREAIWFAFKSGIWLVLEVGQLCKYSHNFT